MKKIIIGGVEYPFLLTIRAFRKFAELTKTEIGDFDATVKKAIHTLDIDVLRALLWCGIHGAAMKEGVQAAISLEDMGKHIHEDLEPAEVAKVVTEAVSVVEKKSEPQPEPPQAGS